MIKENVDVIIFVEHLNRELEVAKILREKIIENKFSVIIKSTFHDMYECMVNYMPKIIFVPWCYDDKDFHYFTRFELCGDKQPIIINFHHEQIINKENFEFFLPKGKAIDTFHISWGKIFTEELKKVDCRCESIIQCGNPRLDFYNSSLISRSLSKAALAKEFSININKKWILFIDNFCIKDYSKERINEIENRGVKKIKVKKEHSQINYIESSKWLKKLLSDYKDIEIIYRLHPSSNIDNYKEIVKLEEEFNNFHIINKYSVRNWLINCEIINQWTSTTVIEAAILNKCINIINPSDFDIGEIPFMRNVRSIKHYYDFYKANIVEDKENREIIIKAIRDYYDIKQKLSVDLLIELINKIMDNYKQYHSIFYKDYKFKSNYNERYRLFKIEKELKELYKNKIINDSTDKEKIVNLLSFIDYPNDYLEEDKVNNHLELY